MKQLLIAMVACFATTQSVTAGKDDVSQPASNRKKAAIIFVLRDELKPAAGKTTDQQSGETSSITQQQIQAAIETAQATCPDTSSDVPAKLTPTEPLSEASSQGSQSSATILSSDDEEHSVFGPYSPRETIPASPSASSISSVRETHSGNTPTEPVPADALSESSFPLTQPDIIPSPATTSSISSVSSSAQSSSASAPAELKPLTISFREYQGRPLEPISEAPETQVAAPRADNLVVPTPPSHRSRFRNCMLYGTTVLGAALVVTMHFFATNFYSQFSGNSTLGL